MSEYQYYEFCRVNGLLSQEARKEMGSLSSRARVTTHGASYVYNYGDFRGDVKKLLLKYFDVFFYISNFGTIRLIFKYPSQQVDAGELNKHCIRHVINCEQHDQNILLDVHLSDEESGGWTEGEGILPDLLPLYEEIKTKNYGFLRLVAAIHHESTDTEQGPFSSVIAELRPLSEAQSAFLECVGRVYEES